MLALTLFPTKFDGKHVTDVTTMADWSQILQSLFVRVLKSDGFHRNQRYGQLVTDLSIAPFQGAAGHVS